VSDHTKSAVYDVRQWLWAELQLAGIMKATDYHSSALNANLVPVIPVTQRSEFMDEFGSAPFIVYDSVMEYQDPNFWESHREQVMFSVYSDNSGKSNQIKSLMFDLFRRFDESAKDLNHFNALRGASTFAFLSVKVLESSKTEPLEEVGGRYAFDIIIEIEYLRSITSTGGFGVGRYA
jgi:hypothetical protein